jgi:cobalt-zinc-cadmium resistance protein CzcA
MNKLLSNIIAFSLKNQYFIFMAAAVLLITGIITFNNMPIEAFPDTTNTEIDIITQWPGRSAEEVEKFVTIPIEIAMNPVQQKVSLRSTSIFGLSYVKLIFEDHVLDKDARNQVNSLLGNADLPDGIQPAVQPPTGPTGEIFRYTLRSSFRDKRELKTIQDWIIDRQLRAVPGVGDINSFGGEVKAYEIKVDPGKLSTLGISPLDFYTAVSKSNVNIGGDIIEKNDQAYAVRGIGLLNNINEIKNVVVQNINGIPVLVSDVADVEISNQPRLGLVARSDAHYDSSGKRSVSNEDDAVEAIVVMRKGENPSQVLKAVEAKINDLNTRVLPRDTKIVPYYNRTDLIHFATHTVLHNLLEGILLVTLLVSLFMFNWRTTLIVSIVIPLSLLFAFICLNFMGMSANLLSLGAVDFGIIIDGAVVMVEGMFVILDQKAKEMGMSRFNKMAKTGLIKQNGTRLARAIFTSKVIIIIGLLPIFAFQKVEGKLFSPLAYTLGFALLGALILTLTLVPVLIKVLLHKDIEEKHNPVVHFLRDNMLRALDFTYHHKRATLVVAFAVIGVGLFSFKYLGTEFLPEFDEGAIWMRAQLHYSVSLEKSKEVCKQIRSIVMQFPQVKTIVQQTGRPDDGTDVTGFYNNEFDLILYPEDDWKPKISKDQLIEELNKKLSVIPGMDLNFSQPISDNVEEAVSGVKGSICMKVIGDSLDYMEAKTTEACNILKHVRGITDLGVIQNLGQPELDIDLNQQKMALYGVSTADANAVIAMAIGGVAVTQLYEGFEKFDIRIRFPEMYRDTEDKIGDLMVPTSSGSKVPIKEIADITLKTGPCLIFRDANERYSALKFSVRDRDMGGAVKEAIAKVNKGVKLQKGYRMIWQGDFENQQRASKRLAEVVPISLMLIFLVLFMMFGNLKDASLIFLNVPFAIVGGLAALYITHTNFSISAGIGFICLFGICIQDGVLLITVFKQFFAQHKGEKGALYTVVKKGVATRIRPVMMTALMAAIGLFPAAVSHGIGSESAQPLARVVIGGILCAMIFSLLVFPLIFAAAYRKAARKHVEQAENSKEEELNK